MFFLNIFIDVFEVFWLLIFDLLQDTLYESIEVTIFSAKYLTEVVEFFI